MRPTPPPIMPPPGAYPRQYPWLPVTRLRVGRVVLLALLTGALLIGGTIWLLTTKARPLTTPTVDSTAWPAWLRQVQTYPVAEVGTAKAGGTRSPQPQRRAPGQARALTGEVERQRQELRRSRAPAGTTIVPPKQNQAAKVPPPPKANASMLFVAHELRDPQPAPKAIEYTLRPAPTKLPCMIETAINSDVEEYFTAKVSTNVYDTATDATSWYRRGVPCWGMTRAVRCSTAMSAYRQSASPWRCRMGARWTWARHRSPISKASPA